MPYRRRTEGYGKRRSLVTSSRQTACRQSQKHLDWDDPLMSEEEFQQLLDNSNLSKNDQQLLTSNISKELKLDLFGFLNKKRRLILIKFTPLMMLKTF